jgi:DNA-binding SARP family transcriptional activator/pimeloyl-ACP methyl ester carboxylesterase
MRCPQMRHWPASAGGAIVTGLRIQLTGELRVEADDRVLDASRLGGERARLVFALLVLERGRPLTRDQLAEAVWEDRLPPTWRPALRNVLSRVRALVAEAGLGLELVSDATGCYRLRCPEVEVEVDLEAMERSLEQARAALAADDPAGALELAAATREVARRLFLAGLEGSWIEAVRARQRYALASALEVMGKAALRSDPSAAVARARELIELDPLSEEGYRLLMRAQLGIGNRAEALTAYAACRAALVKALGVEPSAETQDTYLSVLRSAEGEEDLRRSKTRFVEVGGSRIAYQTAGAGAVDIVFVFGSFAHVDTIWHDPAPAAFFSRLLPSARLIFFDPSGTGASDAVPDEDLGELVTRRVEELSQVLDAAGAVRPAIVGEVDGGPVALRFAATHPERVEALVLVNTTARWVRAEDYGEGLAPDVAKATVERVAASWGTEEFAAHVYPALRGDERFLAWFARLQRTIISPHGAARALRRLQAVDERPLLSRIRAPTLVLHRRDHPVFALAQGRYLAEHIPRARLEVLEGSEGLFGEDSEAIATLILEFALAASDACPARR